MFKSILFPFPLPLTTKQWIYIAGTQCLIAGFVDGGANFGIAYAMYHGQKDVRMWVFSKNTIAGDLGVTPFIQTAVSMIITSTLVHTDLHHSMIKPLPYVWPHVQHLPDPRGFFHSLRPKSSGPIDPERQPKEGSAGSSSSSQMTNVNSTIPPKTFRFYFWMLIRFIFEGTEQNMLLDLPPGHRMRTFFKRLGWTAVQGLGLGLVVGFPLWCLAIVILGPIYGKGNMGNVWAPQAIKLVYGFLLGILTNPIIALLALGSQAEHNLVFQDQPIETVGETLTPIPTSTAQDIPPSTPVALPPPQTPLSIRAPPRTPSSIRGRTRSGSYASWRGTSFTAHIADIPLASPLPPLDPPMPSTPGVPNTPTRRPRAMTQQSEAGSYYSLGGTGGRAQRTRRASYAPEPNVGGTDAGREEMMIGSTGLRLGTRERGMTESTISPQRPGLPMPWLSLRTEEPDESKVEELEDSRTSGRGQMRRLQLESKLMDTPRESLEIRAEKEAQKEEQDVFGK